MSNTTYSEDVPPYADRRGRRRIPPSASAGLGGLCLAVVLASCAPVPAAHAPAVVTTPAATPFPTPTPPTIPGVPSRVVHFATSDGVHLGGVLYGSGHTAVVCSEEYMTSQSIWVSSGIVQHLVARGDLVMTYDFRGVAASDGTFSRATLDVDLRAAIAFARQAGATRIALLGSSMGGTASLKVAGSEPVGAVITLSAPQVFGISVTPAVVAAIRAPLLFVNSQHDTYSSDTVAMYGWARAPKQIRLYAGAEHGIDILDDPSFSADLSQRIVAFILRYAPG